jgi:hypothetical protein
MIFPEAQTMIFPEARTMSDPSGTQRRVAAYE